MSVWLQYAMQILTEFQLEIYASHDGPRTLS